MIVLIFLFILNLFALLTDCSNPESPKDASQNNDFNFAYPAKKLSSYFIEKETGNVYNSEFSNSLFLDHENKYFLQWKINITHVTFQVQVETLGWIGLGLSSNGGMTNADMAVMWIDNKTLTLQDRFAEGYFEPLNDTHQDLIPINGYENETHTIVTFSRLLSTCDKMDRKITRDTVFLLYAYHSKDPPGNKLMQHEKMGQKSVILVDLNQFREPENVKKIQIRTNKFNIPSNLTTYHCVLQQLKNINKGYYIVGVSPLITEGNEHLVHHIIIHACGQGLKNKHKIKTFSCYESHQDIMLHCIKEIIAVWAKGQEGYEFPKNSGLPLTTLHKNPWVVLEIHYNNFKSELGLDSSGLNLYLTNKVETEIGQLMMGSLDFSWSFMIPPQQNEFTVMSYCSKNCVQNIEIPEDGLNVFMYFLHAHTLARKVKVKIIRDGKELEPKMSDENYNFDYQIVRSLPVPIKIKKDDDIIVECTYSSKNKSEFTFGGMGSLDEMCVAYFYYYPRTDFFICGSMPYQPDLMKNVQINLPIREDNLAMLTKFQISDESKKRNKIISEELNASNWNTKKKVKSLLQIFKNISYYEVCMYSSIPSIKKGKFPQYELFDHSASECESA